MTEPPRVEWVPGQLPLPVGPRVLSLFSGYGGLDMAVCTVLGGHVVAHAEVDPAARAVLEARFPGVPNLGDVAAVDWRRDVGPVDVIAGGFPCQDVSLAGRRLGIAHDTRSGLWGHMAAAVDELRPGLVVIENVRGLLSARANHPAHGDMESCPWCVATPDDVSLRALGAVLGDLSDVGYDAAWQVVSAADVGAPHRRARVFIVAWPTRDAAGSDLQGPDVGAGRRRRPSGQARGSGRAAADTRGEAIGVGPGLCAGGPAGFGWGRPDDDRRAPTADTDGAGGEAWRDTGHDRERLRVEPVGPAAPAADTTGDGRHEGRTEPARLLGGSDAAIGGDAATYAHGDPVREQPVIVAGRGGQAVAGNAGAGSPADASCPTRRASQGLRAGPGEATSAGPTGVTGGCGPVRDVDWGNYAAAVHRWEHCLGRPAPSPTERGRNGQPRLSPRFVEWLMGLPAGWVTDVDGIGRNDQLRLLGNGVVPQQAAAAIRGLLPHTAAPPDLVGAACHPDGSGGRLPPRVDEHVVRAVDPVPQGVDDPLGLPAALRRG